CDWTVEPDWKLGNVTRMPMRKMVESGLANKFLNGKANLSDKCRSCKYLNYCQGGCPVHRRVAAADETPHPSYFCEGYYAFFEYAFERMSKLVEFTARRQRIPYAPPPLLEAAPAEKA
ncbi:MAG TPA: SPASM domain-containing protein, partial [Chloroflexota bacterium]|nr:SPASM domain-containing protein [Chloroflexota bacterium]